MTRRSEDPEFASTLLPTLEGLMHSLRSGAMNDLRVAADGLPARVEHARDAAGAIVVVDGSAEWWDAAASAIDGGARAVVVAEPLEVPE